MIRIFTLFALAVSLSACAGDSGRFYKDGVSPDEHRRDAYECERDTNQSAYSFGRGATAPVAAARFRARCMEAKGYTFGIRERSAPAADGWVAR